ncbi:MAG: amino acid ABC transporter substrate-binding protein, partial [Chitinophagaceae bacterium]
MRKTQFLIVTALFFCLLTASKAIAQPDIPKHKIAIFTPLYLDSAFNEMDEYRYSKNTFPKFINPGLEFYEGAQLALDSLKKEYVPLEVFIYDTKSA